MARKKGILSGLLKPKKKKNPFAAIATPPSQSVAKRPSKPMMIKVAGSDSVAFEIPMGPREGRIYTYDGRPLKGTRKGNVFRMNIVRGIVGMESIYTGMQCDDEANSCITYDGFAVGYLGGGAYYVSRVVEKYGNVSIAVRRDGTDPNGGWPLLVALLPEIDWFKDLLGIKPIEPKHNPDIEIVYLPDKVWKIKPQDDSYSLMVRLIPTPKGSSAKPHLDVLLDGISCAEVSATYGCYKTLVKMVDAGPFECTLSKQVYSEDDISRKLEVCTQVS